MKRRETEKWHIRKCWTLKQRIADSWPDSLDDTCAREEYARMVNVFNLACMTCVIEKGNYFNDRLATDVGQLGQSAHQLNHHGGRIAIANVQLETSSGLASSTVSTRNV